MLNLDAAHALIVAMMAGAVALWRLPGACRCPHCAYHVREQQEADRRQKLLQHDVAHKGWGRDLNGPDIYSCNDPACDRNPQGPTEL